MHCKGWSSGKVDVRDIKNGQVIHKEIFKDSIAGLFVCDYNMDRKDELIVVTVTGEMSGFQVANNKNKFVSSKEDQNQARKLEQDKIRELLLLRHSLQLELRNYENNNRISEVQQYSEDHQDFNKFRTLTEQDGYGAIPANTQLKSSLTLCTGLEDDREVKRFCCCTNCLKIMYFKIIRINKTEMIIMNFLIRN